MRDRVRKLSRGARFFERPDGTEVDKRTDGTVIERFPDGGSVVHNPFPDRSARERQAKKVETRKGLGTYSFVWVNNDYRLPPNSDERIFDKFEELHNIVRRLVRIHRHTQRLKSDVGRLRGTLPAEQQKRAAIHSLQMPEAQVYDLSELSKQAELHKRCYGYEIGRSELVLAWHQLCSVLSELENFIAQNGLGTSDTTEDHFVPVLTDDAQALADGAYVRLFKHNLGQGLLLLLAGQKAQRKIQAYIDEIPEYEASVDKEFFYIRNAYVPSSLLS
jgi:hypothetical protein